MNRALTVIFFSGLHFFIFFILQLFSKIPIIKQNFEKYNVMIIFTIGLIIRIFYSFSTPEFQSPDEQAHFNYITYLAHNHTLPVQIHQLNDTYNDYEYYQPPLYYILSAFTYKTTSYFLISNAYKIITLRITSVIIWIFTTLVFIKTIKILNFRNTNIKICAISIFSLLPSYTFISSMINNDNLSTFLGTIIFMILCQSEYKKLTELKTLLTIGILLGLSLLTKMTGVIYLFMTAIRFLDPRIDSPFITKTKYIFLMVFISFLIPAPWFLRNIILYKSLIAEDKANIPMHWPFIDSLLHTVRFIETSFWSVSGRINHIKSSYPVFGIILHLFSLFGIVKYFKIMIHKNKFGHPAIYFIIFATVSLIFNYLLVLRFGILYGQGQGRFLFPSLSPISILIGIGSASAANFLKISKIGYTISLYMIFYSISFAVFTLLKVNIK